MSVLWKEILEASSLAACMQDIYEAVSQNKIAALQLETLEGTINQSPHFEYVVTHSSDAKRALIGAIDKEGSLTPFPTAIWSFR